MANNIVTPEMVEPAFNPGCSVWHEGALQVAFNIDDGLVISNEDSAEQMRSLAGVLSIVTDGAVKVRNRQELLDYLFDVDTDKPFYMGDPWLGTFMGISNSRPVENQLENPLRLYFNPGTRSTVDFFHNAVIFCREQTGEVPSGKFRFDGFDVDNKHKDRVVMYPKSFRQAKAMMDFAKGFQPSDPRPTAPLAHQPIINGEVIEWIGLGEDPDLITSMGQQGLSLTASRIRMIMEAARKFDNVKDFSDHRPNCTPEELADEVASVALEKGVNGGSFSFNKTTDIQEIEAEIGVRLMDRSLTQQ